MYDLWPEISVFLVDNVFEMRIRFFAFLEPLDVALMAIDNKRRTKEGTDRGDVGKM